MCLHFLYMVLKTPFGLANLRVNSLHNHRHFRPDIQGLRAIAVLGVLIFHIWPNYLPGGYVGVDVFFVISGFLITGLLLREAEKNGRISLIRFYERRVRRLVPAATLVLLAVAMAISLLPQARWETTAIEIIASALYVENWRLAWLAVDYLGSEAPPSPLQHYWSLSIEEQFYLIWPLLMIAVLFVVRRIGLPLRACVFLSLLTITLASFAVSVVLSYREPALAYFVTHTRIWELGVGGLLAFWRMPPIPSRLATVLHWGGLAAILVACLYYSSETIFPGYTALLPTLGAAAIIAAGNANTLHSILTIKPMQYVGDISYSVYLWHWPLVVFAAVYINEPSGLASGGAIVLATWLFSDLTKRYVEDRFRQPASANRAFKVVGAGGLAVFTCVLAGAAIYQISYLPVRNIAAATEELYPGPSALLHDAHVPHVETLLPVDPVPWRDLPDAYRGERCHLGVDPVQLTPCVFGRPDAPFSVFVIGDSHAANWIPAFEVLASERDWYVETHTKSACPVLLEMKTVSGGRAYEECHEWGGKVISHIHAAQPNLVVVAMSAGAALYDRERDLVAVVRETLDTLSLSGAAIVAIADTPRHGLEPSECVELDRDCFTPREDALRSDSLVAGVSEPHFLVDMNHALCNEIVCPIVIGNVVAWRDTHHFTATYSRMLAGTLAERLPLVAQ